MINEQSQNEQDGMGRKCALALMMTFYDRFGDLARKKPTPTKRPDFNPISIQFFDFALKMIYCVKSKTIVSTIFTLK